MVGIGHFHVVHVVIELCLIIWRENVAWPGDYWYYTAIQM